MNNERETKITTPMDILDNYSGIDVETRGRAEEFLDVWDGWQYGCSPRVAAAMAVYYANMSKDGWTQQKVKEIFDVSIQSMRNWWTKAQDDLPTETLRELELGHYS